MILSPVCVNEERKKGKEKIVVVNVKRRAYYQTDAGLETKRRYREKADVKRWILNELTMLNVSKKAQLSHEKIENLIKML